MYYMRPYCKIKIDKEEGLGRWFGRYEAFCASMRISVYKHTCKKPDVAVHAKHPSI